MLLDTASMYYRAFHSMPESMVSKDGTPVNAIRGLLERIIRLKIDRKPDVIVAAWDTEWRPQWRVDLIPSYKTHRIEIEENVGVDAGDVSSTMPDSLSIQIPIIEDLLNALGIPVVGHENYEADDIIGTYASSSRFSTNEIVTGDRDLFQLINDQEKTSVLYTSRTGLEHYREEQVLEKYSVKADQYVDFSILRGDPSDGLPGVKGIGEKTAAKLINDFNSLENLILNASQKNPIIRPKIANSIIDSLEYIEKARKVVPVVRDVKVPNLNDLEKDPVPRKILLQTAEDLNLRTTMLKFIDIFNVK